MFWNVLRVQSLNSTAFRRLHGRLMASRFLPCHRPVTTYSGGGNFHKSIKANNATHVRIQYCCHSTVYSQIIIRPYFIDRPMNLTVEALHKRFT